MPATLNALPTIGTIATRHNVTIHQVQYAIRRLNLQPIGRAGIVNVYPADAADAVGGELRRIAERRSALLKSLSSTPSAA